MPQMARDPMYLSDIVPVDRETLLDQIAMVEKLAQKWKAEVSSIKDGEPQNEQELRRVVRVVCGEMLMVSGNLQAVVGAINSVDQQ